ncbi:MAG TPA: cyclodeaminase/cyclohydrolase family protein [Thermoanaerobaculia bacterium]|nr:cyclodeaminase/cyclohydrolase family protein [Thermoanaerobaculia bacterium]
MTDLASLPLHQFVDQLASDAPAPGGGSASAAVGAQGAALLAMVIRLTLGKEKYKEAWEELDALLPKLEDARARLLALIDEDTRAYDAVVAARRLPKETPAEKAARQKTVDEATVLATTVPMQTAFFSQSALAVAPKIAEKGNPNASSDAFVAGLFLAAAVEGGLANVRINLPGIVDKELANGFREDAEHLQEKSREALKSVREIARARTLIA